MLTLLAQCGRKTRAYGNAAPRSAGKMKYANDHTDMLRYRKVGLEKIWRGTLHPVSTAIYRWKR